MNEDVFDSRDPLLSRYLDEMGRRPRLDPETERHLLERYQQTGDRSAANRIIESNLRLVISIATQYRWRWASLLDLIQEGNVGLTIAINRYDPASGVPFGNYAGYWIRAMILRYVSANYRMVDMGRGRHSRKLFFKLQQERRRLEEAGHTPTTAMLAKAFGVPESAVQEVDRFLRAPAISLSEPVGRGEGEPVGLLLADHQAPDPEQAAIEADWRGRVRDRLDLFGETLEDDRERTIWQERFCTPSPLTCTELGRRFGVSKQRISQVEHRLRKRLRGCLEEDFGGELESVLCEPGGWNPQVRGVER